MNRIKMSTQIFTVQLCVDCLVCAFFSRLLRLRKGLLCVDFSLFSRHVYLVFTLDESRSALMTPYSNKHSEQSCKIHKDETKRKKKQQKLHEDEKSVSVWLCVAEWIVFFCVEFGERKLTFLRMRMHRKRNLYNFAN